MKPDLNLLAVLDALCRTGSVSGAAAVLSLSQPAISHALNRLRAATGDPLFTRSGRGLVPTARARAMAEAAADLVQLGQRLLGPEAFDPALDRPRFRLGASDLAAQTILPGLVSRLQHLAPGSVVTVLAIGATTLQQLTEGALDLAFWGTAAPPPPLRHAPLFDDHFVAVLRRGHPALEGGTGLDLAGYLGFPHAVVSLRDPGISLVDTALAELGQERRIGLASHSFAGNLAAVRESDLVATMPASLTRKLGPDLVAVPLPLPLPGFSYGMVWHPRTEANPAQAWLRGLIQRQTGLVEWPDLAATTPAASVNNK